jgi:hypothetical protein
VDPLTEFDWAAHWRSLVEARDAEIGGSRSPAWWDRRSRAYHCSTAGRPDPFEDVIQPFLDPRKTLIDVGAGWGKHVEQLAGRLDWVTAVEPSQGQRENMPPLPNLTVVASTWEEAEVAPADLVISCHVLYPISDPVAFIRKMEASGREHVFIYLRDRRHVTTDEKLYEALTGRPRTRQPGAWDCYNLLRAMGIEADITYVRYPTGQRFESVEAAVDDCSLQLGTAWREEQGKAWIEANLIGTEDGTVGIESGEMVSGVLHWAPTS